MKKQKRKKSPPKRAEDNYLIYSPSMQRMPIGAILVGFFLRMVVIVSGVMGIAVFLVDAFQMPIAKTTVFFYALLPVVFFSLMSLTKQTFCIGAGILGIGIGLLLYTVKEPIRFLYEVAAVYWNSLLERLINEGYPSVRAFLLRSAPFSIGWIQREKYLEYAFFLLLFLVSILFVTSLIGRVRLLPLALFGIAICGAVFTYNITTSNWGFVLIIAALCGAMALKMYDKSYVRDNEMEEQYQQKEISKQDYWKKKFQNQALGGFVGFVAVLLTFGILFFPALKIDRNWRKYDFIDQKMEQIRESVSAILMGDTPNLSELGFFGNMETLDARSTKADARSFTGKEIMRIRSNYDTPLYLRSWIGSELSDNAWNPVTEEQYKDYKARFGNDFIPEQLRYSFYEMVNPQLVKYDEPTSYSNHLENGFITMQVNIKHIGAIGNLMFLPTFLNPQIGFRQYGTEKPYSQAWRNYYDGIITGKSYMRNAEYSTVSFVPSYRDPDFGENLENDIQYYRLMASLVQNQIPRSAISTFVDERGLAYSEPNFVKRYGDMSPEEQEAVLAQIHQEQMYEQYVDEQYADTPYSERMKRLSNSLYDDVVKENEEITIHKVVMKVIQYLSENMTYTLTPKETVHPEWNALESFLFDTKEGYCVQFASTAAILLRYLNIKTRYVEGYIASSFIKKSNEDRVGRYEAVVHDYDAHAWIEVYRSGIGWVQYEATTPYQSAMYEPLEPSVSTYRPISTSSDYLSESLRTDAASADAYQEYVQENARKRHFATFRMIGILFVIAAIATIAVLALGLKKASEKAYHKRQLLLERAKSNQLSEKEIRKITQQLNDSLIRMFSALGFAPLPGELPEKYAIRIQEKFGRLSGQNFTKIIRMMEKEEFGFGLNAKELALLADYLNDILHGAYSSLNFFEKFWFRHIKRAI